MIEAIQVYTLFFRVGLFIFGGGVAIVPIIQSEIVAHGYVTFQQSIDLVALSQIAPGPFALNAATFCGIQAAGFPGAVAAVLGLLSPSLLLSLFAARFFFRKCSSPTVQSVLYGVRPVVLGLIAAAFFAVLWSSVLGPDWRGISIDSVSGISFDFPVFFLAALGSAVLIRTKFSPILLVFLTGLFGAFFLR